LSSRELNNFCFSPNITSVIKDDMGGNVARTKKTKNAYRILVGKRSLLKLLGRGWEDKIRIGLKGSWEEVDWILLAQDRDN